MLESRAEEIVQSMAKKRGRTVLEVLVEWRKYQKNGECDHFWPDENTACRVVLKLQ